MYNVDERFIRRTDCTPEFHISVQLILLIHIYKITVYVIMKVTQNYK